MLCFPPWVVALELLGLDLTEGHPVGVVTGDPLQGRMEQDQTSDRRCLSAVPVDPVPGGQQRPSKIGVGFAVAKHRVSVHGPAANPGQVSGTQSDAGAAGGIPPAGTA